MKRFFEHYFGARAGERYENPNHRFASYSLSFDSGARLELMQMPSVPEASKDVERQFTGYIHLAFAVGSEDDVDALTTRLGRDGYQIVDGPRRTGDGYYGSTVLDPDHNRIEITAVRAPEDR